MSFPESTMIERSTRLKGKVKVLLRDESSGQRDKHGLNVAKEVFLSAAGHRDKSLVIQAPVTEGEKKKRDRREAS